MNRQISQGDLLERAKVVDERMAAELPPDVGAQLDRIGAQMRVEEDASEEPWKEIVLVEKQPEICIRLFRSGAIDIVQQCWPDEEQGVRIASDRVDAFVDKLTDVLGYGGVKP
jgi:hypothetical protein